MSEYAPDRWVVLEFDTPNDGVYRKVLASWYGGYSGSDSWKLSSAVQEALETDTGFEFYNQSGSVYYCSKNAYGMSSFTSGIYQRLLDTPDIKVTLLKDFISDFSWETPGS